MVIRPRRTLAQTAVAVVVLVLMAGGVWLAVSAPRDGGAACVETTLAPPAREVFPYDGVVVPATDPKPDEAGEPSGPPPLTALVPHGLPFVLTTSRKTVGDTTWFGRRGFLSRLTPYVGELVPHGLRAAFGEEPEPRDPLHALGAGTTELTLRADVFGGEVVLAGDLEASLTADGVAGRWGDVLVLTRISPRLEAWLSRMTVEEVSSHIAKRLKLTDLGGGMLQVEQPDRGGGIFTFQTPRLWGAALRPTTAWYLLRAGDVVALSNGQRLIREVAELAACSEDALRMVASTDEIPDAPDMGLAAWVDLPRIEQPPFTGPMHGALFLRLFAPWLLSNGLEAMRVTLDAESPAVMRGRAEIDAEMSRFLPEVRRELHAPAVPTTHLATRIPARSTFAFLRGPGPARLLLRVLRLQGLTWQQHREWDNRVGRGMRAAQHDALEDALADRWCVALAQSEESGEAGKRATRGVAWAFVAELAPGEVAADVRGHLLAWAKALHLVVTRIEHEGGELFLLTPPETLAWPYWLPRAFSVTEDVMVLASERTYMEAVVDTSVSAVGAAALTATPGWQEAMAGLPSPAHACAYLDLKELYRVPDLPDGPAGQGGVLWNLKRAARPELGSTSTRSHQHVLRSIERARRAVEQAPTTESRNDAEEALQNLERRFERMKRREREEILSGLGRLHHLRGLGATLTRDGDVLHIELEIHADAPEGR